MGKVRLSRPTLRELIGITFALALLCVVIAGAQFAFVKWQLTRDDLADLSADAKNITSQLRYAQVPDLAHFNKAYIDAGPYMLIDDSGIVINVYPSVSGSKVYLPAFLPKVFMPWLTATSAGKAIEYVSPLHEQWQLLTVKMQGGYGVVGLSQYDVAADREALLVRNAAHFPANVESFRKADADAMDNQISWALVATDGTLLAGDGEIPFRVDPTVVGSALTRSGYTIDSNGTHFYVHYSRIDNASGAPAAVIIGFDDVTREIMTLHSMLLFCLAVGAIAFVVCLSLFIYSLIRHETEKQQIRESFQKYFSPQILEAILREPDSLKDQRREISVMFSDIRSFTSISEKLPPERLTRMLQEYFDAMTEEVMATEGVVDKFIGDGIMAFWGAPIHQSDHADRAIATARGMINRLEELKQRWQEAGTEVLEMGIAINLGVATIGNIGSRRRSDYTAIGDVVNVASRLEGLNKRYNSHVIISEAARRQLMTAVKTKDLGWVELQGHDDKVHIHEVLLDS